LVFLENNLNAWLDRADAGLDRAPFRLLLCTRQRIERSFNVKKGLLGDVAVVDALIMLVSFTLGILVLILVHHLFLDRHDARGLLGKGFVFVIKVAVAQGS